jgi:hypothetical protein
MVEMPSSLQATSLSMLKVPLVLQVVQVLLPF